MRPPLRVWALPVVLAAVLATGALVGRALGDGTLGVALAAVGEVVFLLSPGGRWAFGVTVPAGTGESARRNRSARRFRQLAVALRDLRRAVTALPDAVVLLDGDNRVRWFNRAAETLLGLRRPRDRGALLLRQLPPSQLADWLHEGGQPTLRHMPAPAQPGKDLHVTVLPFGPRQRLLLARDVSELGGLEQIRRDFVANVSHELRTPLTVIHGYLELIDPEDVPELAPVLGEMRAQSRRMGQIIEDLLVLSRLESQQQLVEERVEMAPMLAILRKEAEALSQGRHQIVLDVETHADLLGSVKDLHSALSNLVSNAVRYTPTGGSITIRWRATADGATYSVADTGFGIAASHLARLTERFYRVSSSRSRETGGTGLGLSIVKHVLSLHQARLTIESTPGQGSTFSCLFDRQRLLAPVAAADADGNP